jgi:hypothetical protein
MQAYTLKKFIFFLDSATHPVYCRLLVIFPPSFFPTGSNKLKYLNSSNKDSTGNPPFCALNSTQWPPPPSPSPKVYLLEWRGLNSLRRIFMNEVPGCFFLHADQHFRDGILSRINWLSVSIWMTGAKLTDGFLWMKCLAGFFLHVDQHYRGGILSHISWLAVSIWAPFNIRA